MARHSAYNKEPAAMACGASLLPFRTSCKGPVNTGKVLPTARGSQASARARACLRADRRPPHAIRRPATA